MTGSPRGLSLVPFVAMTLACAALVAALALPWWNLTGDPIICGGLGGPLPATPCSQTLTVPHSTSGPGWAAALLIVVTLLLLVAAAELLRDRWGCGPVAGREPWGPLWRSCTMRSRSVLQVAAVVQIAAAVAVILRRPVP